MAKKSRDKKIKELNDYIWTLEGKCEKVTRDEAEAYLAELSDVELDDKALKNAAGGACWHCLDDCGVDTCPCRD